MPNSEIKIANRLYFSQEGAERHSRPAVRVALAGIIVGVVVMILTLCIVVGFKQTVTQKVAGFGAHIQVVSFDNNNTYDMQPIEVSDSLLLRLGSYEHVRKAAPFITKPGMLKTDSAFHGIVLKGTDYWNFFRHNIIEGGLPTKPNQIIISQTVSSQLQLQVGDGVYAYFVDDNDVRARRFTICLDETADRIYFATVNKLDENGYQCYYVQTLQEQNPAIFAWLDLLDMNVVVIIILMLLVAGFNIVSGLIILILDGIQLIGTLKALGADNGFVRRVFLWQAALLIGKGVLYGNSIAFILASIQYKFHLIPLESATYYVSYVPIAFPWGWILALNGLTIGVSLLILLLPSMIITKISPAKVMHFE